MHERLMRLAESWKLEDAEMGACFGVDRRTFSRWCRPGKPGTASPSNAPASVLLEHYERGGETPHSKAIKAMVALKSEIDHAGALPDEESWEWRMQPNRVSSGETWVVRPGLIENARFHWGIGWAKNRLRYLRSSRDFKGRAGLIEHYEGVVGRRDKLVKDQ